MKEKLLAGEVTTRDFWLFWIENATHNGTEDPGHQPIVPYDDRRGVARGKALITWRTNGIHFVGTQEGLKERTEAGKREATVDVEAVRKGDGEEQKKDVRHVPSNKTGEYEQGWEPAPQQAQHRARNVTNPQLLKEGQKQPKRREAGQEAKDPKSRKERSTTTAEVRLIHSRDPNLEGARH